MKTLYAIAIACVAVSVLIGIWKMATFDYCPIMYGINCLK